MVETPKEVDLLCGHALPEIPVSRIPTVDTVLIQRLLHAEGKLASWSNPLFSVRRVGNVQVKKLSRESIKQKYHCICHLRTSVWISIIQVDFILMFTVQT